jgi:hypothetical protein
MKILLVVLIWASCLPAISVFSTHGLGEDQGVFAYWFADPFERSSILFTASPICNILYEAGDYRGTFWAKPLEFSIRALLPARSALRFDFIERFDHNFDIFTTATTGPYQYQRHIVGRGGINAISAAVSKTWFDRVTTGAAFQPLFGSSNEFWEFRVTSTGYTVTDTITYRYTGFFYGGCVGLKIPRLALNAYAEQGSDLNTDYTVGVSSYESKSTLPQRLGLILAAPLQKYLAMLQIENSRWSGTTFRDPWRIGVEVGTGRTSLRYQFHPWYIDGITEHDLGITRVLPIARLGSVGARLNLQLRRHGPLYELSINPALHLRFDELFALRRK